MFWTLHRRWTTKRPAQEDWPHRPLVQQESEMAEILVEHAEQVCPVDTVPCGAHACKVSVMLPKARSNTCVGAAWECSGQDPG